MIIVHRGFSDVIREKQYQATNHSVILRPRLNVKLKQKLLRLRETPVEKKSQRVTIRKACDSGAHNSRMIGKH